MVPLAVVDGGITDFQTSKKRKSVLFTDRAVPSNIEGV